MKLNRYKNNDVILGDKRNSREIVFKIIVFLCFLILFLRLLYLQVLQGNEFSYLAERNQYKLVKIDSPRGKIFDSKNRLVVTNGTGYRLIYSLGREENEEYIKEIAKLTDKTEEVVRKRIKYGEIFPYTKDNVLFEDLDEEKAHRIIEIVNNYPYLEVQVYSKRKYLYDTVASHTIGYVKKISEKEYEALKEEGYTPRDMIGKLGIEKTYDDILRGRNGFKYIEVNALNKIEREVEKVKSPIVGKNLYMGINMELQQYMEEEFEKDGRSGSFVALNPKTGEIITIVSYPTYSLNTFSSQISPEEWNSISNDPRKILTNKTIAGEYPPGSTFKMMSAIAFLKSGIDPKLKYNDYTGYYQIGNWKWRAWKRGGHGATDMKKSLVESANTYYYKFSDQIGYAPIVKTARDFGLGDVSGIDIPGEKKGIIPDPDWKKKRTKTVWYRGDTILLSIGQGFTLVTPIQLAKAYTFLANKGWAYEPHIVSKIEDLQTGKIEIVSTKKTVLEGYQESYYDIINDALIATVDQNNGTTRIMRNPYVKVAAKSGSAQNPHSKLTHAWVAGYFPADKEPEVVFVCLLEGAGGGGVMAGGMAKKFLDKYLEVEKGIVPVQNTPYTEPKTTNSTIQTNGNQENENSGEGIGEEREDEERETGETSAIEGEGEQN
ncbi:penicillin-binding protein 2 (plasmid) [Fusobacterium vincentii]|uniref:penicillin-binding protein 2 n=1 Tax=Fusobacterium TaxID=848 RepID=UPI001EEEDE3A|nr:penicillin-binding protein 2 [Fusobacterium nucleatum]MCG6835882.1 penicillin-binding protein 2 [Fusobacterium nucleatum]